MKYQSNPTDAQPRTNGSRMFSAAALPLLLCSAVVPLSAMGSEDPPIEKFIEIRSTDATAGSVDGIDAAMLSELSRAIQPFEQQLRHGAVEPADIEAFLERAYDEVIVVREDDAFEYIIVWHKGAPLEICLRKIDVLVDDSSFAFPAMVSVELSMTLP